MKIISYFLLSCLLSLILYFITFGFIIHKPLSIDIIKIMLAQKLNYLQHANQPRLIILAGSNARYSHSCAVLEAQIKNISCTNTGISAGVGLDFLITSYKNYLKPNDIIYMPLEYSSYIKENLNQGSDAAMLFFHDKQLLLKIRGWKGFIDAMFLFDIKFFINGLGEMVLQANGLQRNFTTEINLQGDEIGHTQEKAKLYRNKGRNFYLWEWENINKLQEILHHKHTTTSLKIIQDFLLWAKQNNIKIIGGLPSFCNKKRISKTLVADLQDLYHAYGHDFLILPHYSQYPVENFYDTCYHLYEEQQQQHSLQIAKKLQKIIMVENQ